MSSWTASEKKQRDVRAPGRLLLAYGMSLHPSFVWHPTNHFNQNHSFLFPRWISGKCKAEESQAVWMGWWPATCWPCSSQCWTWTKDTDLQPKCKMEKRKWLICKMLEPNRFLIRAWPCLGNWYSYKSCLYHQNKHCGYNGPRKGQGIIMLWWKRFLL